MLHVPGGGKGKPVTSWCIKCLFLVFRKKYQKVLASVVLIQKNYRAYFWKKSLLRLKASAVTLQRHWRGHLARSLYQHLLQQQLRQKQEVEERRKREEEEQIRREEEERQWQEEEERRRKQEEEEVKERYKTLRCGSGCGAAAPGWHWNSVPVLGWRWLWAGEA